MRVYSKFIFNDNLDNFRANQHPGAKRNKLITKIRFATKINKNQRSIFKRRTILKN